MKIKYNSNPLSGILIKRQCTLIVVAIYLQSTKLYTSNIYISLIAKQIAESVFEPICIQSNLQRILKIDDDLTLQRPITTHSPVTYRDHSQRHSGYVAASRRKNDTDAGIKLMIRHSENNEFFDEPSIVNLGDAKRLGDIWSLAIWVCAPPKTVVTKSVQLGTNPLPPDTPKPWYVLVYAKMCVKRTTVPIWWWRCKKTPGCALSSVLYALCSCSRHIELRRHIIFDGVLMCVQYLLPRKVSWETTATTTQTETETTSKRCHMSFARRKWDLTFGVVAWFAP